MAGRRPKNYSQAARVLRMVDHLGARHYGATFDALAEEFGVSTRQVRRDIKAIEEAGYACELCSLAGRAGVRLIEGRPSSVRLSIRERYTLLAIRRVFDALRDTPFYEDVHSIYDKIAASLPAEHQQDLSAFRDRFIFIPDGGTKVYRGKEDVLNALLTGVILRRRVECRYRSSAGNLRRGLLDPYSLVLYRHGLYVVGSFDREPEARTFAAERFTSAEFVRGASFEVPPDFDIDRFFDGAFGVFTGGDAQKVVAVFEPEVARLVKSRIWHPTQRLKPLRDGRIRLELELSNLTQVAQWLVGWGPRVRVVQPKALRERVLDEHREAACKARTR